MTQHIDLIHRYYAAFNRRDAAAYERCFTPDCLIEAPGVELRGIEGARAFDKVWQTAMPDTKIANLHATTGDRFVMCENRLAGTHTGPLVTADGTLAASGKRFDERYMAVFELAGERIARQSLHFDRLHLMQVLGGDATAANLALARGVYAAYGRRDMAWILGILDEEVTWGIESVAARQVPHYSVGRGKDGVVRFFTALAETADFEVFEPSDFVASGEHVFNTLRYEATVKATGKRVRMSSPQHWTFKRGRLVAWRGYEDTAALRDAFTAS
jgi:ketosteroid isomerase-like protein